MQEWEEIRQDTKPKTILVARNGKEEEVEPTTSKNYPDGTYVVREDGTMKEFEEDDSDTKEDRE